MPVRLYEIRRRSVITYIAATVLMRQVTVEQPDCWHAVPIPSPILPSGIRADMHLEAFSSKVKAAALALSAFGKADGSFMSLYVSQA